jgi:carboxymethylenebutenolidase
MAETIKLKSKIDGFEFAALHAAAEGHRKGGIVIIQEIFGLDKYVQEDVARWAAKGFEALAPSMYDRQEPGFTAAHDDAGMQAGKVSGLSAGSSYYGGFIKDNLDLKLNVPIICHFGRKDGHIPADEIKAGIEKGHPDVPVYIYENSGHGFNNDGRPDSDLADAELARKRSLEFFEAHGAA